MPNLTLSLTLTFQYYCWQRPHPCSCKLLSTHTSTGDPPTLAGRSGPVSRGVTAPSPWVLVHIKFYLCPPRMESLFPPVLWKSCNSLAFKVRFHRDFWSLCQIPRLGSLMWGSEPSQQWENFFSIIVLQFVGCLPRGYGIWFYCDCAPPIISLQLLCFGHWVSFFGELQSPLVNVCSIAGCNFSALYLLLFLK